MLCINNSGINSILIVTILFVLLLSCSHGNKFSSDAEVNRLRDSAFYNYYEKPHFETSYEYYNLLLKTKSYRLNDEFYAAHAAAFSGHYSRSVGIMKQMLKRYKDQNAEKLIAHIIDSNWNYYPELSKENGFREVKEDVDRQKSAADYTSLATFLNNMRNEDQRVRFAYRENTARENDLAIDKVDSLNHISVDSILNLYGFLSYKKIGYKAAKSLSILYLHLDSASYMHNFHYVRKAYKKHSITSYNYAQILDRYLVRSGKKQKFGNYYHYDSLKQHNEFYPIRNFKTLEKRRRKMNLDSLAKFARDNNITYPPK